MNHMQNLEMFSTFFTAIKSLSAPGEGGGGGRIRGLIFAGYVPLGSQSPYPIIVYSVANYRSTPSLSILGKHVIFAIPT